MNRLLVFLASVSIAVVAISSACVASPSELGVATGRTPSLAAGEQAGSSGWSTSSAPSELIGGGLLSL